MKGKVSKRLTTWVCMCVYYVQLVDVQMMVVVLPCQVCCMLSPPQLHFQ